MKFELSHSFDAVPALVAEMMLDRDFQASLDGLGPLARREVLSQEAAEDGRVERRVRCVLGLDLGAARRFVGDGDPAWIEISRWDPDAMAWTWHVEPEVGADLLSAAGRIELVDGGGGTLRTISGEVKVRVPLYGAKVEGWIVDGLKRAYDEEARLLTRRLSGAS